MYNNLDIGLKGYELLQVIEDKDLLVHVELKRSHEPQFCPFCSSNQLLSKGSYLRKVRHLQCFGRFTTLHIHTRRFQCKQCRKTFLPTFPGILKGRHSSEPFRNSIFEHHHQGICAKTLAQSHCIGEATVERIYQQFTQRKATERITSQCPYYLGIDEHTLHKGQRFCTTFCDLKNHKIFDVQPGKSEAQLRSFLLQLKGRDKVRMICIDLSSPYRNIIKRYFPNAKIVADRFHVIRIIYQHFIQLARLLVPDLKHHRGSLAALRTAPHRLTPKRQLHLNSLFKKHPILQDIHHQMHQLRTLMNQKHQTVPQSRKHIRQLFEYIDVLEQSQLYRFPKMLALMSDEYCKQI